MADPLATVAQLAAYVQEDIADDDAQAALSLQIASGTVRSYLGYDITRSTATEVCDPINGSFVVLSQLPVTDVQQLEYLDDDGTWVVADGSTYTTSIRQGILAGKPGVGIRWPVTPGSWRVSYGYGYDIVPDAIVGVVLGVAARQWATPVGVESERVGSYNVRYADKHDDAFTPIEQLALRPYRQVVIA